MKHFENLSMTGHKEKVVEISFEVALFMQLLISIVYHGFSIEI